MVGTVTFSAKRSLYPHAVDAVGTQYAVGTFSAKRLNPRSGVCSRFAIRSRYAVGTQYTVGLGAKR